MTLTDFLLARIAEEELLACEAMAVAEMATDEPILSTPSEEIASHVARWNPLHVLAECEVKRDVIQIADVSASYAKGAALHQFQRILAYLARPYVEHPDYDEAWRMTPS